MTQSEARIQKMKFLEVAENSSHCKKIKKSLGWIEMFKKMSKKTYRCIHCYEKELKKFSTTDWSNKKTFAKNILQNFLKF